MKNIPNERKKFIWISTILSYMDLPKYCYDIYKIIDPHLSCSEKSYLRGMCHTVYQLKTYSSFADEIGKHDVSIFPDHDYELKPKLFSDELLCFCRCCLNFWDYAFRNK